MLFLVFVGLAFVLQFEKLYGFLIEKIPVEKILLFLGLAVLAGVGFILLWIYAEWKIIIKLKEKLSGLLEGMQSIYKMKAKWNYIFHSFLIFYKSPQSCQILESKSSPSSPRSPPHR